MEKLGFIQLWSCLCMCHQYIGLYRHRYQHVTRWKAAALVAVSCFCGLEQLRNQSEAGKCDICPSCKSAYRLDRVLYLSQKLLGPVCGQLNEAQRGNRIDEVERVTQDHSAHVPYSKQGHLEYVAQGHALSASKHIPGWTLHNLSGQPSPELK